MLPILLIAALPAFTQGPWTALNNPAPNTSGGLMLLLSDGTVMVKSADGDSDGIGNIWNRLTPDATGSYINGTWSPIASMNYTRLYFSTRILKDGRVYAAGGEYGSGGNTGEIYDPVADSWTIIPDSLNGIYDANSELLPDGEVFQAIVGLWGDSTAIYNPLTNTYRTGPTCVGMHDESAWLRLPDNSILFNDFASTASERYIPSLNQWVQEDSLPVYLYTYVGETGPAFMLPDGRAIFFGASGHNAFYTPSGNSSRGTWSAAPDFPNGQGMPDASASMLPNGKILCAVSLPGDSVNSFPSPVSYYEFNYLTNSFAQVNGPYGTDTTSQSSYVINMLNLPDGSVLYTESYGFNYFIYTPGGTPVSSGKPTITGITHNSCNSFTITGTLFNGISEGSAYGDDWQMATNYPIIQLSSGGLVYYARSFNWNRNGVQTGSLPDTAQFGLPSGITVGTYSLVVIANGIASDPVSFTVPNIGLSSTLTPPAICSNSLFTYIATSDSAGASITWTRAAVSGITNQAITTPQSTGPDEVLVNTTSNPLNVVYTYSVSGSCNAPQQVTVQVNPQPVLTITGPDTICNGNSALLSANGGTAYAWSSGDSTSVTDVVPATTTTYTVTALNNYGCQQTASKTVTTRICTGLDPIGSSSYNSISVQPNPATDQACIVFNLAEGGSSVITLFDIYGQAVKHENTEAVAGENRYQLYFSGFAKGVYLVVVQKDDVILKSRLVVQ